MNPALETSLSHVLDKRYDLFLSYHGSDVLYSDLYGATTTMRDVVEQISHNDLQRTWLSTEQSTVELSIYSDAFELPKSPGNAEINEILYGLLQTRGGGLFVGLITKDYFMSIRCLMELACAFNLMKRDEEKEGNLRICLVAVGIEVDEVLTLLECSGIRSVMVENQVHASFEVIGDGISMVTAVDPLQACQNSLQSTMHNQVTHTRDIICKMIVQRLRHIIPGESTEESIKFYRTKIRALIEGLPNPVRECQHLVNAFKIKWRRPWCRDTTCWEKLKSHLKSIQEKLFENAQAPIERLLPQVKNAINEANVYDVVILGAHEHDDLMNHPLLHYLTRRQLKCKVSYEDVTLKYCRHVVMILSQGFLEDRKDWIQKALKKQLGLKDDYPKWECVHVVEDEVVQFPKDLHHIRKIVSSWHLNHQCFEVWKRLMQADKDGALKEWQKYLLQIAMPHVPKVEHNGLLNGSIHNVGHNNLLNGSQHSGGCSFLGSKSHSVIILFPINLWVCEKNELGGLTFQSFN